MNEIIKKNGITYGITIGVISVLITTLIYTIDLNLFTSWWIGISSILIYIITSIILLSKTKKQLNGIFTFKEAFTTYFIAIVVGILISVTFNIILFNFIDPEAKTTIKEITTKFAVQMMQKFNAPASEINKAIKEMSEKDPYSIGELLKGSIFSISFSAIFGLLFAAIFKTKTIYKE